ncbi:DUF4442 domain-containing protein [uncultured Tenacibaculum sp.]|uniref:DUF4442 domain-containing protein n=1 Tax=uncultured Tenacibaculum sp. TaxID=174713 RepID=UPI00261494DE|nr:DUF4442 domain-containing protein [uncultured Tenacibaculum sp.]
MKFTPRKINLYLLYKLPSAFITGIRVKTISDKNAVITVKHKWINQNPFKSMFWAIQGMAAEFSTGILMVKSIKDSGERISMLVTNMNATFTKKATGRIIFECNQGELIQKKIQEAIETKEGQTIILTSEGFNEDGVSVSKFDFEWSIKVKS